MPDHAGDATDHAVVERGLTKAYRGTVAVDGLDLTARAGHVTAVLGPNGAGKTTTVECCEGLRRPDGGTVRVLGLDPVRDSAELRTRVGVMLQDGGLPSTVPAAEALRHVAAMYARPRDLAELTDRLGLASFARTQVRRLSGGQRQRLALATALVGRPELVFLDEPSAGMDPQSRLAVWDLVRELRSEGTTIVVTTHQMAEAEALADEVAVVDHGRTLVTGTVAELVGAAGHATGAAAAGSSGSGAARVRVTLRPTEASPATSGPDLAASLGAHLARADRPVPVVALGESHLEVHAEADPVLVHAVTAWALTTRTLVTSLEAGHRTLEDVFLDLTGRSLR